MNVLDTLLFFSSTINLLFIKIWDEIFGTLPLNIIDFNKGYVISHHYSPTLWLIALIIVKLVTYDGKGIVFSIEVSKLINYDNQKGKKTVVQTEWSKIMG